MIDEGVGTSDLPHVLAQSIEVAERCVDRMCVSLRHDRALNLLLHLTTAGHKKVSEVGLVMGVSTQILTCVKYATDILGATQCRAHVHKPINLRFQEPIFVLTPINLSPDPTHTLIKSPAFLVVDSVSFSVEENHTSHCYKYW